jgi:hypothetical protein
MKTLKKFVLIFIGLTIVAGTLLAIPLTFRHGIWKAAAFGLKGGLLFGAILTLVFVGFYFLAYRMTPPEQRDLIQRRELIAAGSLPDILDQCYRLLKSERFVKLADLDEAGRIITARTRMSWACPGEKITIHFSPDDGKHRIVISSEPVWRTTMIDYGKNFKNVEALQKLFRDRIGAATL